MKTLRWILAAAILPSAMLAVYGSVAAHRDGGKLPWRDLFEPSMRIATDGFKISPRMSASIASSATSLQRDPEARAHFLKADGTAKDTGTLLRNPALAATFRTIANGGIKTFYGGALAQDIVDGQEDVDTHYFCFAAGCEKWVSPAFFPPHFPVSHPSHPESGCPVLFLPGS